ncbi:MAG: winged helix-turn-helix domain-containing protein, partial [Candidatus Nitrotoga sp.]|nr:winged helix-turn-helix domain-containing protein [Candidatus Nitrotoga sp.]
MEKEDARKQSREVLHERRKQVIRMHRKGVAVMEIVAQTGLSWTAVNTALGLYKAEGSEALKPGVRGKKPGSRRHLTVSQELTIQQTICDRRPEQLKMDFALWSRPAVRQHIEQAHGIKLSIRAVGNYLARWDFTPQKPIKKAY